MCVGCIFKNVSVKKPPVAPITRKGSILKCWELHEWSRTIFVIGCSIGKGSTRIGLYWYGLDTSMDMLSIYALFNQGTFYWASLFGERNADSWLPSPSLMVFSNPHTFILTASFFFMIHFHTVNNNSLLRESIRFCLVRNLNIILF